MGEVAYFCLRLLGFILSKGFKINFIMQNTTARPQKFFNRFKSPLIGTPNFVEPQLNSFKEFIQKGLKEVFEKF